MDLGLAFSFPFQDEKWIEKILIAALISIIPIIGWLAVLGWSIEIGRRVIQGDEHPLADWSDFGGLLTLGFKGFLIGVIFAIPLLLAWIPLGLFSAVASSGDGDAAAAVISFVSFCFICLTLVYSIALLFAVPASYGRLAATDSLGEALRVGELWRLVNNAPGPYLLLLLGYIIAGFIASLGGIACFVGIFLTGAYALAVEGSLFGQAYQEGMAEA